MVDSGSRRKQMRPSYARQATFESTVKACAGQLCGRGLHALLFPDSVMPALPGLRARLADAARAAPGKNYLNLQPLPKYMNPDTPPYSNLRRTKKSIYAWNHALAQAVSQIPISPCCKAPIADHPGTSFMPSQSHICTGVDPTRYHQVSQTTSGNTVLIIPQCPIALSFWSASSLCICPALST